MLRNYKLSPLFQSKYARLYLVAFFFYYLVWVIYNYHLQPDTEMYLQMGRGIFEQCTFGYKGEDGLYYPVASRMPVVPFFLGLFYFITKDASLTYFLYSLFQVFLAPIIPCIAFFFGSQLNKKVAYGAYAFLLFHANVMAGFVMILTDAIFAVLSGLTFVALWTALQKKEPKNFLLTGLLTGLSCMTRPIMKLYYLVVAVLLLARFSAWKPLLRCFVLFLLGFVLVLAPWIIRNFIHYGAFVLETNQGLNMLWTNWPLVRIKETDPQEIRIIKEKVLNHGSSPMNIPAYKGWQYWREHDYQISKTLQKIAIEAYLDKPMDVFHNWRENFLKMTHSQWHYYYMHENILTRPLYLRIRNLNVIPRQDFERKFFHLYCEISRLIRWCYFYVAPLGLFLLLWRERKMGIFCAVHILYFTGLTAFVAGYDRYRLNIEVFYAILIIFPIIYVATLINGGIKNLIGKRIKNNEVKHNNSHAE